MNLVGPNDISLLHDHKTELPRTQNLKLYDLHSKYIDDSLQCLQTILPESVSQYCWPINKKRQELTKLLMDELHSSTPPPLQVPEHNESTVEEECTPSHHPELSPTSNLDDELHSLSRDSESSSSKPKKDLLMSEEKHSTSLHPEQPQLNLEPRTHPLGGEGAQWKGIPLDDKTQRELDRNPEEQLNIGSEGDRDERALHCEDAEWCRRAAEGGMPGVRSENKSVKVGNKIKGELKYFAGKLTGNAKRMEEGKTLQGKKYWEQDSDHM
ncbi:hypothetical protein DL96DRAFT_1753347 [Flagelloscypha sp. PMI_526]|nr:hypothetical protein DL96DRAFT_1753347 [Flagelloscypha sp. PMI_526]